MSISLEDLRIGGTNNTKSNSGIIGYQNWLKTGSYLKVLLRRLRDYSLIIKYRKLLQKINDLGI